MLHDDAQARRTCQNRETEAEEDESGESIDSKVAKLTRAVAPVLLPMIESLGAMEADGALAATASGEAT
jgi:hypothetical protein